MNFNNINQYIPNCIIVSFQHVIPIKVVKEIFDIFSGTRSSLKSGVYFILTTHLGWTRHLSKAKLLQQWTAQV